TIAGVVAVAASADGAVTAAVRESFSTPPELWVGAPGRWTQRSRANEGIRPAVGRAVSVRWRSDRFDVQGFLLYPRAAAPGRPYPMIVEVHGGPSSSVKPTFYAPESYEALESAAGYAVFMPNPRGSYGQGEAFTRANVRDFSHGDLKDVLAGVD